MKNLANEEEVALIVRDMGLTEEQLYDESGDGDLYPSLIDDGLSDDDYERALRLEPLSRGNMLVWSPPGAGKGVFTMWLVSQLKTYLNGKKVLMDFRPRKAFGAYIPFTEDVFMAELAKMEGVASGDLQKKIHRGDSLKKKRLSDLSQKWLESSGAPWFQNSVLVLDELKRYFHNRNPFNPMGIMLGHLLTQWRHLDMLMLGMAPFKRELDQISYLPYLTHEVTVSAMRRPFTYRAHIQFPRAVGRSGVYKYARRSVTVPIDGAAPRDWLDGLRIFDLYNSKDIKGLAK